MVMLVWYILSLFGVCSFTWLPVFIDTLLTAFICGAQQDNDSFLNNCLCTVCLGLSGFAFYKFFFALSISGWWAFASPIAMLIVLLFPGGFTIVNLLFKHFGLMTLPTWGLIVGIVLDVLMLIFILADWISKLKMRRAYKAMQG